jgi:hypothetical protein
LLRRGCATGRAFQVAFGSDGLEHSSSICSAAFGFRRLLTCPRKVFFSTGRKRVNFRKSDLKCSPANDLIVRKSEVHGSKSALVLASGKTIRHSQSSDKTIHCDPSLYRQSEVSPHYMASFSQACLLPGAKISPWPLGRISISWMFKLSARFGVTRSLPSPRGSFTIHCIIN